MKKSFILPALLLFAACSSSSENNAAKAKQEILAADSAMFVMAREIGLENAFLHYADSNIVMLNVSLRKKPIKGKSELKQYAEYTEPTIDLSWHPQQAGVSESGDLGYSWGYFAIGNDSMPYGYYSHIWKKQTDGSWKILSDAGNTRPREVSVIKFPD